MLSLDSDLLMEVAVVVKHLRLCLFECSHLCDEFKHGVFLEHILDDGNQFFVLFLVRALHSQLLQELLVDFRFGCSE